MRLPTSTVNEHVTALEKNLGMQLVIRTTRASRLTEAAQPGLDDGSLEILLPEHRLTPAEMSIVHYGPGTADPRTDLFSNFLQAEMTGWRDRFRG
jgi:Bacterial regulatory helix-turn-helix protein, lysR family